MEPGEFEGVAGRTLEESTPWWPPLPSAPEGAPNVVIVLLDDVGYAQFGCYGSDIATPTFDRLAARRPALLELPHDRAVLADPRLPAHRPQPPLATAWPASSSSPPASPATTRRSRRRTGSSPRSSCATGYATFAVGKWHLAPGDRDGDGQPARHVGRSAAGFERFYGFMGGETDQYHPDLVHDNHQIDPPRTPEEGYHLTEDLADQAIRYLDGPARRVARQAVLPLVHARRLPRAAPGAAPSTSTGTAGSSTRAGTRGARRCSPASWRRGCCPTGTELSERPHWVAGVGLADRRRAPAVRPDDGGVRRLPRPTPTPRSRRVLDFIDELGELDNTIVVVMSDNGASAPRAAPQGSFNEQYFFNFVPESLEENLRAHRRPRRSRRATTTTRGAGRGRATRRSSG